MGLNEEIDQEIDEAARRTVKALNKLVYLLDLSVLEEDPYDSRTPRWERRRGLRRTRWNNE